MLENTNKYYEITDEVSNHLGISFHHPTLSFFLKVFTIA